MLFNGLNIKYDSQSTKTNEVCRYYVLNTMCEMENIHSACYHHVPIIYIYFKRITLNRI